MTIRAEDVLDLLRARPERAVRVDDLLRALPSGTGGDRRILRRLLRDLTAEGRLARVGRGRYVLLESPERLRGVLTGYGESLRFIPGGQPNAVPVPVEWPGGAFHGDEVEVRVAAGPVARVVQVLRRADRTVLASFRRTTHGGYAVPQDPRLPPRLVLDRNPEGARSGDLLLVAIEGEPDGGGVPPARLLRVVGEENESNRYYRLLEEFGLPLAFPADVLDEAERLPSRPDAGEVARRLDLRDLLTVTVDPANAFDHDDAVSIEALGDGIARVGIHIADVGHFVPAGSALDREAAARGNSVYLEEGVVPMFPEELTRGILSLLPDVDRLCLSVLVDVDGEGRPLRFRTAPTVIRSARKLSYEEAEGRLARAEATAGGSAPVPGNGAPGRDLDAVLLAMWRVADGLRGRRAERGALDMEILEPSVEWGPDGEPVRIHREPRLRSHRLIEEFMLLANEAVARYLGRRAISFMYRVHEPPDPERLEELAALLRPMGYTLPGGDPSRALAALLRQAVGSPDEEIVSYQILRSMKKAQYSERNLGHFGLASGDYTHFTSPIRRYPDLTVHRALVEAWRAEGDADPFGPHPWTPDGDGEEMRDAGTGTRRRKGRAPGADDGEGWREDPVPGEFEHAGRGRGRGRRRDTLAAGGNGIRRAAGGGEAVRRRALAEIARHATEREILADQAERASFQQASALYMQEHLGEEFEGTIVALVKSGLFVRLRSMPVEGLVLLSSLGRDRFRVWETMGVARGERTGRTFRLGESVRVRAVRADVEMRQIDFELLAHTPRRGPLPPERPPSRRERGARRHRRRS